MAAPKGTTSDEIVLGLQTPWEPAPCSLFHVPKDVRVPLAVDVMHDNGSNQCAPPGACRSVGSAALLESDALPHRLVPSLDPMRTKAGEGRCISVVIHKTSTHNLEVWVDGRKQPFETTDTKEPQQIKLPPARIHGKVASPVSIAFFCEEGCARPENVTVRYKQVLKMQDQVVQEDVCSTANVQPITTRNVSGKSVVVPYPLSYIESPYIQIRDVLPLRRARARRMRALATTAFFVALGFFLESFVLYLFAGFSSAALGIGLTKTGALSKFFEMFDLLKNSPGILSFTDFTSPAGTTLRAVVAYVIDMLSGLNMGSTMQDVFEELIKVTNNMKNEFQDFDAKPGTPLRDYPKFMWVLASLPTNPDVAKEFATAAVAPVTKVLQTFLAGTEPPPIHFVSYTLKDLSDNLRILGSAHEQDLSQLSKMQRVLAEYLSEKSETQYLKSKEWFRSLVGVVFAAVNLFKSAVNSIMSIPPFPRVGDAYMRGLDIQNLRKQACATHTIEVAVEDTQLCGMVPKFVLVADDNDALVGGLIESGILEDMDTLKTRIGEFQKKNASTLDDEFRNLLWTLLGLRHDFKRLVVSALKGKDNLYMTRSRRSFRFGASRLYGNLFGIADDETGSVFDSVVGRPTRGLGTLLSRVANKVAAEDEKAAAEQAKPVADSLKQERAEADLQAAAKERAKRLQTALAEAFNETTSTVKATTTAAGALAVLPSTLAALLPSDVIQQFDQMVSAVESLVESWNLTNTPLVEAVKSYRDLMKEWFGAMGVLESAYAKYVAAKKERGSIGPKLPTLKDLKGQQQLARIAFQDAGGNAQKLAAALRTSANEVEALVESLEQQPIQQARLREFLNVKAMWQAAEQAEKATVNATFPAAAAASQFPVATAVLPSVMGALGGYLAGQAVSAAALASVTIVGRLGDALARLTAYECDKLGVCLEPLRKRLLLTAEWQGAPLDASEKVPPQDCRVLPTFLELVLNTPSAISTRDGIVSYLSSDSNASTPTGAETVSPSEVSSLLSKAMQNVRVARQAFRDSRDDILSWQLTSNRTAIVQFRMRPLKHVRALRFTATYAPFALNVPRDVAARAEQNPCWNNKYIEEMVSRPDADSLWSTLKLPDTPVSWAAAHVFSDLVTDVQMTKYASKLRLMYSGTDIVKMRFKDARALLLDVARLQTSFHTDEALFQCLPGGVDAYRMLSRIGILRSRSFTRNIGTDVRVLSYDCRELITNSSYMDTSPAYRKAIDTPPALASMLVDCIDAFSKLSASEVALKNGIPSLASLGCSTLYAPHTDAAKQFVEDAHRRYDSVDALIKELFNAEDKTASRLRAHMRHSQPFYDPSTAPVAYDVHVARPNGRPYDVTRLLESLYERNARMTIMTTDSIYEQPISPATFDSDVTLGKEAVQSLRIMIGKQTFSNGKLENEAPRTRRRRLLVPIGAGDFWYHFPYSYPRSGAFLFDLIPVDLTLLNTSLDTILADPGEPDPSNVPIVPEVREHVRGNAEALDLDARLSLNGQTLIPTASVALSDNPESHGISKIIFNAERIAQGVLALMGETQLSLTAVRVVQPVGYIQSEAERRRRQAELEVLRRAIDDVFELGVVSMNEYLTAANNTVVQIRDGTQRKIDEAAKGAEDGRLARLKEFLGRSLQYARDAAGYMYKALVAPSTNETEEERLERTEIFGVGGTSSTLATPLPSGSGASDDDDEAPHQEPGAIVLHEHCDIEAIAPKFTKLFEYDPVVSATATAAAAGPSSSTAPLPTLPTPEMIPFTRSAVVAFFKPDGRDRLQVEMAEDAKTPTFSTEDGIPDNLNPGEWTWDRPRGDPDPVNVAAGEKTFRIVDDNGNLDAAAIAKNKVYADANADRLVDAKIKELNRDIVVKFNQELKDAQDKLLAKVTEFVQFNESALKTRTEYNALADRRMVFSLALAHLLLYQVLGNANTPLLIFQRSKQYQLEEDTAFGAFWDGLHQYISSNQMTTYDQSALYFYMFSGLFTPGAVPSNDMFKPATSLKGAIDARLSANPHEPHLLLGELAALCDALCQSV